MPYILGIRGVRYARAAPFVAVRALMAATERQGRLRGGGFFFFPTALRLSRVAGGGLTWGEGGGLVPALAAFVASVAIRFASPIVSRALTAAMEY